MNGPHEVTREFEAGLCEYTGARYAVAVNSCTAALLLAVAWSLRPTVDQPYSKTYNWVSRDKYGPVLREHHLQEVSIPRLTYASVPQSICHAGGWPLFRDEQWAGWYQLRPLPVWDSARRFTSGMYRGAILNGVDAVDMAGQFVCVSFHASKILGLEQGGAILHDNAEADEWFRRARFDGRTPGVAPRDDVNLGSMIGWHCYMNPTTAALGLLKLHSLPQHNADLPWDDYCDLSKLEVWQ